MEALVSQSLGLQCIVHPQTTQILCPSRGLLKLLKTDAESFAASERTIVGDLIPTLTQEHWHHKVWLLDNGMESCHCSTFIRVASPSIPLSPKGPFYAWHLPIDDQIAQPVVEASADHENKGTLAELAHVLRPALSLDSQTSTSSQKSLQRQYSQLLAGTDFGVEELQQNGHIDSNTPDDQESTGSGDWNKRLDKICKLSKEKSLPKNTGGQLAEMARELQAENREESVCVEAEMQYFHEPAERGTRKILVATFHKTQEIGPWVEKVRTQDQKFQQTIDLSPDFVFAKDGQGRFLFANKALAEAFGVTTAEMVNGSQRALHTQDEEVKQMQLDDQEVLRSGKPKYIAEEFFTNAHSVGRWFRTVKIPYRTVEDNSEALIGFATDITELKALVAALRQSEARYRSLFDLAGVGSLMVDLEPRKITECSKGMCHMLGYEQEEIVGKPFINFVHREDLEAVKVAHEEFLTGQAERYNQEMRCVRSDGSCVWTRLTVSLCIGGDMPGFAIYMLEDISQSKRVQELLAQAAERMRLLVENLPVGALQVTRTAARDGVQSDPEIYFNRAIEKITGYKLEEIPTLSIWFEKLYKEDAEKVQEYYHIDLAQNAQGFPSTRCVEIFHKDGHKRLLEFGGCLHPNGEVWVVHDVTERQSAHEKFKTIFNLSSDPYFLFKPFHGTVECNNAAVEIFGYQDKAELLGKEAKDLSPPIQPDGTPSAVKSNEMIERALKEGQVRFEWVHQRRDGTTFPMEIVLNSLVLEGQQMLMAIWHDLTESKKAEAALRAAKEAAEAASKAKSQFLSRCSHEIRTPMNGVIGVAELLLEMDLTAEQRAYVETIRSSGDCLMNLINDLLDLSKIESKGLELESLDFHLPQEVASCLAMLGVRAKDKGLQVRCKIDNKVPQAVVGDPTRLKQILLNLVSNAIKFTEQGHIDVQVYMADSPGLRDGETINSKTSTSGMHTESLRNYPKRPPGLTIPNPDLTIPNPDLAIPNPNLSVPNPNVTIPKPERTTPNTERPPTPGGADPGFLGRPPERGGGSKNDPLLREHSETLLRCSAESATEVEGSLGSQAGQGWYLDPHLETVLVQVEVRDTGMGIPKDAQPRLFKAFMQADTSTARRFGGTGLGLCICKSLVQRMGGRIWMRSEVGKGTTFFFNVKLGIRAEAETSPLTGSPPLPSPVSALPSAAPDRAIFRGLSVLIAEDNKINQMVARKILKNLGCEVQVVENGVEAVDAASKRAYDIILMDCHMPEMDGYEATRHIRQSELGGGTRKQFIVALTASALYTDREACLAAGMDSFLSKPVKPADLEAVMAAHIGNRKVLRQGTQAEFDLKRYL